MTHTPLIVPPSRARVLIVDDEPDIHTVTKLSLKALRHHGQPLEFLSAYSGQEALECARTNPEAAVILLDVVMETSSAGLETCHQVRKINPLVRILLRTGQPGSAPERETIDAYDIDGYLPKAELTSNKLYTAVRTAIRAWEQLVELEQHRRYLRAVHDCAIGLPAFEALESMLRRILDTAITICPSPFAALRLETFEEHANPRRYSLRVAEDQDEVVAAATADEVAATMAREPAGQFDQTPRRYLDGVLVPLRLHRELGYGWIYLQGADPGELALKSLSLLAAHAGNALYAAVAEKILTARSESPLFESMNI